MDLAGLRPATPILKGWYSTNWVTNPLGFTSCSFSVQTNQLNETSHSILFFHLVWFLWNIIFVSSIVLNLFCLMPNCQPSNWFHEPISFTKNNLDFLFGLSTHFKSFFCKCLFYFRWGSWIWTSERIRASKAPALPTWLYPKVSPITQLSAASLSWTCFHSYIKSMGFKPISPACMPVFNSVNYLLNAQIFTISII